MPTLFAAGRIPARTLTHRLMHTPSTPEPQARFKVLRKGKRIDVVYFAADMTSGDVRRSLIDRDGYPDDITVVRDA